MATDSHPWYSRSRWYFALCLSLAAHAVLIAAVGAAVGVFRAPPGAAAPTLRAQIVPRSLAGMIELESAQVAEAEKTAARSEVVPRTEAGSGSSLPGEAAQSSDARERVQAPLPVYYRNDEVDVRATPRGVYSRSRADLATMLGRQVTVKLRLFISESGEIERFELLESDGLTSTLSLEDLSELRFHPAQRKGLAVRSQKVVELTFSP